MTNIRLDLSEVEDLARAFDELPKKLARGINRAMHKAVTVVQGRVVVHTPVFLGNLRGSIFTQVKGTPINVIGTVATNLVYGAPVEFGRRPGRMPPVDALEMWVRRQLGVSGDEARSVAFVVARAIGRRGTKARKMFDKGSRESVQPVLKIFTNMVNEVIVEFDRSV